MMNEVCEFMLVPTYELVVTRHQMSYQCLTLPPPRSVWFACAKVDHFFLEPLLSFANPPTAAASALTTAVDDHSHKNNNWYLDLTRAPDRNSSYYCRLRHNSFVINIRIDSKAVTDTHIHNASVSASISGRDKNY